MTKTFYTLYIYIMVLFAAVTSCTSDDAPKPEPARLHFSLSVFEDKSATRTLPGDPGNPGMPFVKPSHVYAIAVMQYSDGTYVTYRAIETTDADWSDLHLAGTDAISTYTKGSLDLRVLDDDGITLTKGTFYAIATSAPITLSGILSSYTEPTEVTSTITDVQAFINDITFDLPDGSALSTAGIANNNTFLRSVYNTPAKGYEIADKKYTVTARLYHTATRLDIQWDSSINGSGSVLSGNAVTSINVTGLPTKNIHAFTPKGNTDTTSPYQEDINTNPSTKIMGREVRYVPSLQYYPLTLNSPIPALDASKSTIPAASWNNLTLAPWLRIILK